MRRWGSGRRRDLLVGVGVVLPLALLAYLVYGFASWLVGAVAGVVGLLSAAGLQDPLLAGAVVVGLALAVPVALVLVGVVVRHRYGQRTIELVDAAIESVPGLGPVYQGLRRSREVLAAPEGEAFSSVVRVELADGVHALAFRVDRHSQGDEPGEVEEPDEPLDAAAPDETAAVASHVDALGAEDLATVFVPFAPNPIVGGHLLTVRLDRVEPSNLTVPQAVGVLVGLGSHEDAPEPDVPVESFFLGAPDEGGAVVEENEADGAEDGAGVAASEAAPRE